jgi:hypothetical protein
VNNCFLRLLRSALLVKFIINENIKSAEILKRQRAQFDDETLSRTQVYDGVSHLNEAEQSLKTCEDHTFCRENYGHLFWDSQGVIFIDILVEQRTINAAYYSKLLKDRVMPAFRSKRRGRSVRSVCLLHDNACPHTAAVTTATLEEMHRE